MIFTFRNIVFLVVFGAFFMASAQNPCIVHEGRYNGKNIYIQNPFGGSGKGFCVTKVTVNGVIVNDQISSSAFEIDLNKLNLKKGDSLLVIIYHKTDCLPKVLGSELITPKCTFLTNNIKIENDTLSWCTTNEESPLTFIIEQYRWNKWLKVGEKDGVGINIENCYKFPIKTISGENKFRVKQIDYSGKPCISPSTFISSSKEKIELTIDVEKRNVQFSDSTDYEVFEREGSMISKGFAKEIDLSGFSQKIYWINYDSVTGKEVNLTKTKAKKIKHGKNNIRRKSN